MGLFDIFKKNKPQNQNSQQSNFTELGDIQTDIGIVRDVIEYDFGMVSGKVISKQWCDEFKLVCDKTEQFPYAQKCLDYLESMSPEMEQRLRKYLYRYYEDTASWIDEEEIEAIGPIDEDTVMEHIQIGSVIVGDSCRQDRIEFHVEGSCDWEPEHGLEVTISDNKILYVGPYEDYDPNTKRLAYALEHYGYYDPDADPIMNYADKEYQEILERKTDKRYG